MRTLNVILSTCLLVCSFFFSTSIFANNGNEFDPVTYKNVRSEVVKYVQNPDLWEHNIEEAVVHIRFMINEKHELEVLNLKGDNEYIEDFVKERLHHQKLNTQNVPFNTPCNVKIVFRAG